MSNPNTVPLAYNDFVNQIATIAVEQTTTVGGVVQGVDAAFNTILPQALQYAELRIQRDLDLNALEVTNSGNYTTAQGQATLAVSVNDFIVIDTISINGAPLHPVSRVFLQNIYLTPGAAQGPPMYFAPAGGDLATAGATSTNWLLGPVPDQAYPVTLSGKIRAPSLNLHANQTEAANVYTFISTYLPDLLIAAAMVYVMGYQRNFGAQSDEADTAVSWESQYQGRLAGAMTEEARRNWRAAAWSSAAPAPAATPSR